MSDRAILRFVEENQYGVTPSGQISAVATTSVVAADNSYNDSSEDLSVFSPGQRIYVSGFANSANNGYKTVVSATANKLIVKESLADESAGVTVSLEAAMVGIRHTGESLGQDTDTQTSNEVRCDRQPATIVRTAISAGGDVNYELSYDTFNEWLAAAFMAADWSDKVQLQNLADVTVVDIGGGVLVFQSATDGAFSTLNAYQWIEVRGFATAGNNGYFKIAAISSQTPGSLDDNRISVLNAGTLVAEGTPPADVDITMGSQVVNGVTKRSFTLERYYCDLVAPAKPYARMPGMMVDTLNLDVTADAVVTGSFGFTGKQSQSQADSAGYHTEDPPDNEVVASTSDVEAILENNEVTEVTSFTLALANNLRNKPAVGSLGPVGKGVGQVNPTGTVQLYYEDEAVMDKYLDFEWSALSTVVEDEDGNVYIIDLPRVKYTNGRRVGGGINTDIIADMTWEAARHLTEDVTIRLVKFAAADT